VPSVIGSLPDYVCVALAMPGAYRPAVVGTIFSQHRTPYLPRPGFSLRHAAAPQHQCEIGCCGRPQAECND